MVFSVQKFRHYLLGKLFHFYVDHQALLYLINKVLIQGRLMRWMLFLQEYDFKIFHKPGKYHHGADFLSRSVVGEHLQSIRDDPIDAKLFNVDTLEDDDPEWLEIKQFPMIGMVPEGLNTSERKEFILRTLKFTMIENVLYRDSDGMASLEDVCLEMPDFKSLKRLMEETQVGILPQR